MSNTKLGWAGLGNMGTPMVKNLLKAGYPVTVYNRTKEKAQEVIEAGATSADSPTELSSVSDIVLVMVSDDNAVKEIFNSENGLLHGDVAGKLFINISTIAPATSQFIYESCKTKGAEFVDAPVSGSVKPAQDGTLIFLAGGEPNDIERAQPLFDVMGKLTVNNGAAGSGSAAKLAINYFLAVTLQGLAETVLFAKANGISTENMLTIVNEGAVGSGITKLKTAPILKNEFPAAFALKHITKDLRLATEQGIDSPLAGPVYQTYKAAMDSGLGEEDLMAIIKYLEK
ncbi:NAD(P)-dependent oxidoreductase [Mucilaginibacter jinjuensis]|uniref:NAD(P)-dependent oxidoreductase n=1 Tax=Mucilaginibacter jinjuensis TaxID=1176721 RepID=A0ABY7TBX4_9SPHI|nr:NAD(P)-dependent oxidoreductase [Mucilaginibacter jinjuensis]WCT13208.1 NAD(P)-dependent oxidoreductase [Mucilaginibacter jinjuensis]